MKLEGLVPSQSADHDVYIPHHLSARQKFQSIYKIRLVLGRQVFMILSFLV